MPLAAKGQAVEKGEDAKVARPSLEVMFRYGRGQPRWGEAVSSRRLPGTSRCTGCVSVEEGQREDLSDARGSSV